MPTEGRSRQVTGGAYNIALATWSRDGKWIYFRSSRSGRAEIWRIPSERGEEQQVTQNGGAHAVESTDGKTLFYSYQAGVFCQAAVGWFRTASCPIPPSLLSTQNEISKRTSNCSRSANNMQRQVIDLLA